MISYISTIHIHGCTKSQACIECAISWTSRELWNLNLQIICRLAFPWGLPEPSSTHSCSWKCKLKQVHARIMTQHGLDLVKGWAEAATVLDFSCTRNMCSVWVCESAVLQVVCVPEYQWHRTCWFTAFKHFQKYIKQRTSYYTHGLRSPN